MRLKHLILLAGLSLSALPMMADTIYTYTGEAYTNAGAPYTTSDFITGSFTSATVGDSETLATVTPVSFSFTDGVQTFDQGNSIVASFSITTDGGGAVTGWSILLNTGDGLLSSESVSGGTVADEVSDSTLSANAGNTGDPGTWVSELASPVPEPSALTFMGTGLVGVAGMARRRFSR